MLAKLVACVFSAAIAILPIEYLGAQDEDFGKNYAAMTDDQLVSLVAGCRDEKELESLISQLPISVLARHAITASEDPLRDNRFGKIIVRFLWKDFDADVEKRRLFAYQNWQDVKQEYETEATIFDVTSTTVILQKKDNQLVEVAIKKLAPRSAIRLRTYQRIRQEILKRATANKDRLLDRISVSGNEFAKLSDAELLKLVFKCQSRDEMRKLVNRIPFSVLSKHAIASAKSNAEKPSFGQMIAQAWGKMDSAVDLKDLLKPLRWQNDTKGFEVEASVFDVRSGTVILKKSDGALIEVRFNKLSKASADRLKVYQRIRQDWAVLKATDDDTLLDSIATYTSLRRSSRLAAIVAFKGVDRFMDDISHLLKVAGFESFGPYFSLMISPYLEGIERDLPVGTVLWFEGDRPVVVFCLPITGFDDVLKMLARSGFDVEDDGKHKRLRSPFAGDILAIRRGRWAYFSFAKIDLAKLPVDPSVIFGPFTRKYTISMTTRIQNLPKGLREDAAKYLREGEPGQLENTLLVEPILWMVQASSEGFQKNGLAFNNTRDLLNDANELTLGWAVDKTENRTFLDLNLSALKGTQLAKRMALASSARSRFKGFARENAAIAYHGVTDLLDEDREQFLDLIREQSDRINTRTVEGKLFGQLLLVLNTVIESKKIDLAGSLLLKDDRVDLIMGIQVADGPHIDKLIDKLMDTIEEGYKDFVVLLPDVPVYKRVSFYTLVISIPEEQEEAREVFGDKVKFVIGNGPEAIYLGVGNHAIDAIKSGLDSSMLEDGKELSGMQLKFALQPILSFLDKVDKSDLKDMVDSLDKTKKDGIILSLATEASSQRFRIVIQEGVLALIGVAFQNGGPPPRF